MRALRLAFVLVLVATVALAGCPDDGEGGTGYARGGEAGGILDTGEPRDAGAQASGLSASNTSAFVPGSTNT